MGAKLGGGGGGPMADINVTPLIDVVLVLLVVFMVITPMLQAGKDVELPTATQSVTIEDATSDIIISITQDGTWWVEDTEASEDTLVTLINAEYRENPRQRLVIKADRKLKYADVRELTDLLADNRMNNVLIGTRKED